MIDDVFIQALDNYELSKRRRRTCKCKKCGLPLAFKWQYGKWWPIDLDGNDHWRLCKKTRKAMKSQQTPTDEMKCRGIKN